MIENSQCGPLTKREVKVPNAGPSLSYLKPHMLFPSGYEYCFLLINIFFLYSKK